MRRVSTDYIERTCTTALSKVDAHMPFRWSLNPYVGCIHRCVFCYVRAFEQRADRDAGEGYGRGIRVKVNIATQLERDLARASWQHEGIAIGTATDPYQAAEGTYRLTRECLKVLTRARNPAALITRGPLIVRDADVLSELSKSADFAVTVSVPTVDVDVCQKTEPGTAPPRQRLRAVRQLVDAGVKTGVALAPLLPGITATKASIGATMRAARDAGATHIWSGVLRLPPGTREHFLEALQQEFPELVSRYETLYARTANAPKEIRVAAEAYVKQQRREVGIADRRSTRLQPSPAPLQLALQRL